MYSNNSGKKLSDLSDQSDQSDLSDKIVCRKLCCFNLCTRSASVLLRRDKPSEQRSKARDEPQALRYLVFFDQESFNATVRLNTAFSSELSLSLQK